MQAEREALSRLTFPYLQRLCDTRGISFSVVDLRWGITDEQANAGKVLEICLAEIDRCRPFFVGLLGDRYGWRPNAISRDLSRIHPWLEQCAGRSITELEILHGALSDNPAVRENVPAMFYFRNPSGELTIDGDEDGPRGRLEDLKERIRRHSLCRVTEGYSDPAELASLVRRDQAGPDQVRHSFRERRA